MKVDVVIPTRNRPEKLGRCLEALSVARSRVAFEIFVCDSSDDFEPRRAVHDVCKNYSFVHLRKHDRLGLAAARNFCARQGTAPLVVSVDDDVYVYPDAVQRLVDAYARGHGWRVVAGTVAWDSDWSRPVVMRHIGYGRKARGGEQPGFVLTALYLYPRQLARFCPFNERIRSSDDRFIGALWRAKGVRMLFEPRARARHDDEHNTALFEPSHQDSHIYANLFDALLVERQPLRALSYELLGFAAGAKAFMRSRSTTRDFLNAWVEGHRKLIRDWSALEAVVASPLPEPCEEVSYVRRRDEQARATDMAAAFRNHDDGYSWWRDQP
jgi:glycosyltransferase involved in cell wall biosynthesis